MKILAMGIHSMRPTLVEMTDAELEVREAYEAMFERTDDITLSAKVVLQQYAKRIGGLSGVDDEFIDYLSDGTLERFGQFKVRVIGGVSTSAIGNSSSTRNLLPGAPWETLADLVGTL